MPLDATQRRRMLVQAYRSEFRHHTHSGFEARAAKLPPPDQSGNIDGIGTFFDLQGYGGIAQQVYRQLATMHNSIQDSTPFQESLQLLRLVAAPGLGKVGVAREWNVTHSSCQCKHKTIKSKVCFMRANPRTHGKLPELAIVNVFHA